MAVDRDRHSLRYLLLRMLERHKGTTGPEELRALAADLRVAREGDDYVVTTRRGGENKARRYPRGDFAFYRYGEGLPEVGARNERLAERFWGETVGLAPPEPPSAARGFLVRHGWDLGEGTLHAAAAWAAAAQGAPVAGIVLALFAAESWFRYGRLSVPLLLAVLVPILPWAAALAALVWAILEYLDPDPFLRRLRAAAGVILAAAAASWGVRRGGTASFDAAAAATMALAGFVSVARWVSGSHRRSVRILFPFLAAGACVDGEPVLSSIWLGSAFAVTAIRWRGGR